MPFKPADPQNEFKKDAKLKPEDVQMLQEWAMKQPHLPPITDLQVILFLQSCYYSNEQAKTTIDNYFTIRTICPDIFANRNPKNAAVRQSFDVSLITVLPKTTPEGYKVIFMKLMDCDPDKYHFANQTRNFDMQTMLHLNLHGTCNGIVMLMDMSGTVFGHLTKLNIIVMKKFLYYLQEAMPIRLKGLHFINVVSFMDKILALMKPFMKKEMLDMMHIHSESINSLYKFVPKDCLPQEFGGSAESMGVLHEKSKKILEDNADYFQAEEKQLVDESKRAGKPKSAGDFFGMEGTFKKLQVD